MALVGVVADRSVDPVDEGRDSREDRRSFGDGAYTRTPADYTVQYPASAIMAYQRTARITLHNDNASKCVTFDATLVFIPPYGRMGGIHWLLCLFFLFFLFVCLSGQAFLRRGWTDWREIWHEA